MNELAESQLKGYKVDNTDETVEEISFEGYVHPFFPFLAKTSFILYMFFLMFGTSVPFQERVTSIDDISTSNVVNQIVFSALLITSLISMMPRYKNVIRLLIQGKYYTIFYLWSAMTITWSSYPFVSFKRWIQVLTALTVVLSVLMYVKDHKMLVKYFLIILAPYLLISLASVFTIPGAHEDFGPWKALAPSKNHLGQAALFNIIVWSLGFRLYGRTIKFISVVMLIISLTLLFGSKSTTSQSAFFVIFLLAVLGGVDKFLKPLGIGKVFTYLGLLTIASLAVAVVFLSPDLLNVFASSAGKDLTFTGRTNLWRDILEESSKHWMQGGGFQGFWVIDNPALQVLYKTYVWFPNQAHNGYIDILNEIGFVGLAIFIMIFVHYFWNMKKLGEKNYFKWFIIVAIIVNLQESTLIRPQLLMGVMCMFAYYAMHSELLNLNEEERGYDENDSARLV